MKRCAQCGQEYPDDVSVCPRDGSPLAEWEPAPPAAVAGTRPARHWRKNLLYFIVGFAACIFCEVVYLYGTYYFWVRPMQEHAFAQLAAPTFFSPHPAKLGFIAFGSDGKQFNFEKYRGRVIVLNVWATWCPPCMGELPSVGRLATHYATDTNVAVVCVSEEMKSTVFGNAKAAASGAPLFSTDGARLPAVYQTDVIPATFIIDRNGLIVAEHLGAANWADPAVVRFLDSLKSSPVAKGAPGPGSDAPGETTTSR
ncbi:MAG TPA: TlpA disulfide reductase family protein, partial [Verrucomicrobiae bacterium]|nr:TlpA disulfide reductase family protein [Verrucomicrobiae bacterium]